ncbi:MAG: hypothetical protein HW413_931, partial [Thermoleophilia bacterium]|nr:hypothetical protein [Thermoleophilia bacterium]
MQDLTPVSCDHPLPSSVPHERSSRLLPLALVSAAVALLASGCGGPSDEERFAEQVCATILPRAQDVLEVGDDVIHTRAAPGP